MRHALLLLVLSASVVMVACGGSASSTPAPAGRGKKVDPATAGTLTGRVTFTGTPPAPEPLQINEDPICLQALGDAKSDALLVSADGRVQNAFVYIKDMLAEYAFDVPTEAVRLDEKGCRYSPRIFGVRVSQALEIGQPVEGSRMTQFFTAPEVMVRFKCDVHHWMSAYGGVMSHPFFAVTGPDGSFSMKGLPPGEYELAVWHEKLGTKTQLVTIGASQTQTANFILTRVSNE
ncbi:MAG: carboxypeptidase-like regulatory domain-containing protein [Acidobacteriota bacterium]